jgi:hypothetical protein
MPQQLSRSATFRTGRLLTPSMPVSSSAFPAPAAALVAHPVEDVADQHAALCGIRLVEHALVAAAVARDAHIPRLCGNPEEPLAKRR